MIKNEMLKSFDDAIDFEKNARRKIQKRIYQNQKNLKISLVIKQKLSLEETNGVTYTKLEQVETFRIQILDKSLHWGQSLNIGYVMQGK